VLGEGVRNGCRIQGHHARRSDLTHRGCSIRTQREPEVAIWPLDDTHGDAAGAVHRERWLLRLQVANAQQQTKHYQCEHLPSVLRHIGRSSYLAVRQCARRPSSQLAIKTKQSLISKHLEAPCTVRRLARPRYPPDAAGLPLHRLRGRRSACRPEKPAMALQTIDYIRQLRISSDSSFARHAFSTPVDSKQRPQSQRNGLSRKTSRRRASFVVSGAFAWKSAEAGDFTGSFLTGACR
jgi:hypothetical protein